MRKRSFRTTLWLAAALAGACACAVPAAAQSGDLSGRLDAAEKKLDDDIKACRPITVREYSDLADQARRNVSRAIKAIGAGVPVDARRLDDENLRAQALLARAQGAAAGKACPPPNQPPPPAVKPGSATSPAPPPPPPPPTPATGPIFGPGTPPGPHDVLDDIADEADDAADDFYDALDHCDAAGMKRALARIRELADRAKEIAETAREAKKAGFGRIDPRDAEDLEDDLLEFLFFAPQAKPICPLPQPKPQVPPCPPGTKPQPTSLREQWTLDRYAFGLLTSHNLARAEVGVPKLQWNVMLAEHAQGYAEQLARTGALVHSPREGRGIERENLSMGPIGWSSGQMIETWTSEKRFFMPGTFPNVSSTGDWSAVAHYTQVIWPTTTEVGCGMAMGKGYQWLVCRYSPGGNKDGKPVGFPSNACPLDVAVPLGGEARRP